MLQSRHHPRRLNRKQSRRIRSMRQTIRRLRQHNLPTNKSITTKLRLRQTKTTPLTRTTRIRLRRLPHRSLFGNNRRPHPRMQKQRQLMRRTFRKLSTLPPFPQPNTNSSITNTLQTSTPPTTKTNLINTNTSSPVQSM